MVINEQRNRYEILLPDFLLLSDLKRRDDFSLFPGQSFLVEVKKADPWDDVLELAYAGQK
jgi:hypothetical protein